MIKAAVAGAAGRMGKRVIQAILETEGIGLCGALEAPENPALGQDAGLLAGGAALGIPLSDDAGEVLSGADVLIDFTIHEASMEHLRKAVELGRAIVVGTTGFTPEEWGEIRRTAPRTRCLIAPNMSVGVTLVCRLLKEVAMALGDAYDVEILEIHHRRKVDAPSGTALRMAEIVAEALGRDLVKDAVYARHGQTGPRSDREIGIQSLRAGDVVGEHTVIFAGAGERIEITHRAHSRDNFASGAVRAALWLVDQPNGLYDMQDVLGLKG